MRSTTPSATTQMPLTILVWDIAGSCALLSALPLETYCAVLRACQEEAAATIEAHGGFVARYMGDAVLAYFGYPAPRADDPERALRAALALKLRCTRHGITVRSRVALATGPVIVGAPIGTLASREFPAFGTAPSLAARLIGATPPEQVVVDDATRAALSGLFGFREVPGLSLKGFPHVRRAWRADRPARATSPAGIVRRQPPSPLYEAN
jgi:class 3 adenylate cyclase